VAVLPTQYTVGLERRALATLLSESIAAQLACMPAAHPPTA
jgi:hypothetical protein